MQIWSIGKYGEYNGFTTYNETAKHKPNFVVYMRYNSSTWLYIASFNNIKQMRRYYEQLQPWDQEEFTVYDRSGNIVGGIEIVL